MNLYLNPSTSLNYDDYYLCVGAGGCLTYLQAIVQRQVMSWLHVKGHKHDSEIYFNSPICQLKPLVQTDNKMCQVVNISRAFTGLWLQTSFSPSSDEREREEETRDNKTGGYPRGQLSTVNELLEFYELKDNEGQTSIGNTHTHMLLEIW